MDLRYFLEKKLEFIEQFYEKAVAPFQHDLEEVEREYKEWMSQPVYDDNCETDPPQELIDRDEVAKVSENLVGQCCLGAAQNALKEYLLEIILLCRSKDEWNAYCGRHSAPWLQRFYGFFTDELNCDWNSGPVSLDTLEEIVLARNATEHEGRIISLYHYQNVDFARRVPDSMFIDEFDRQFDSGMPKRLAVTDDNLRTVIAAIRAFADWLETKYTDD